MTPKESGMSEIIKDTDESTIQITHARWRAPVQSGRKAGSNRIPRLPPWGELVRVCFERSCVKLCAIPNRDKAGLESQIRCFCYEIFSPPMSSIPLDKPPISPTIFAIQLYSTAFLSMTGQKTGG